MSAGALRASKALDRTARAPGRRADSSARDFIPYVRHVDPHVVRTRDGALIACLALDGLVVDTLDTGDLASAKAGRDLALRSLGSSEFALWRTLIRRRCVAEIAPIQGEDYAARLDRRYRGVLAADGLYRDRQILSLVRRPLQGRAGLIESVIGAARAAHDRAAAALREAEEVKALKAALRALMAALAAYGPKLLGARRVARGGADVLVSDLGGFFYDLLNGEPAHGGRFDGGLVLPDAPLADVLLAKRLIVRNETLEQRGIEPRGDRLLAALSVKSFPDRTWPGQLDALEALDAPFTLTQSFALVDPPEAIARIRGVQGRMQGAEDSVSLAGALSDAADAAAAGAAIFGRHHMSVMAQAESALELDRTVAEIAARLGEAGMIAVREDIGLEPVFWAQLPGNGAYIARRALISSANMASLASCHGAGAPQATSRWGPPLTVLETATGAALPFHLHAGDLAHATLIGPSGSGKTVLLAFLIAQSARIPERRVIVIDKDRGLELAIRALGGAYARIAPDAPRLDLNPLQTGDDPAARAFLCDWLALLARDAGRSGDGEAMGANDAAEAEILADAVAALFAAPDPARRLSALAGLFAGHERAGPGSLAARIARWHGGGDRAWLFDYGVDRLDFSNPVTGFDLTYALEDGVIRAPLLLALFHRIDRALDGRPTLIVLDEGWRLLDDPIFAARIKDWQKTLRKKNAAVVFATQSAQDAASSAIGPALIEQAATQIFFPNPKVDRGVLIDGFGLTPAEADLVRSLEPSARAFLVKQARFSRLARLDLSQLGDDLVLLSGRAESLAAFDRLGADGADGPDDQGCPDNADPAVWMAQLMQALGRRS